jgi:hypothetical protein
MEFILIWKFFIAFYTEIDPFSEMCEWGKNHLLLCLERQVENAGLKGAEP